MASSLGRATRGSVVVVNARPPRSYPTNRLEVSAVWPFSRNDDDPWDGYPRLAGAPAPERLRSPRVTGPTAQDPTPDDDGRSWFDRLRDAATTPDDDGRTWFDRARDTTSTAAATTGAAWRGDGLPPARDTGPSWLENWWHGR